jgi:hypothetical protein
MLPVDGFISQNMYYTVILLGPINSVYTVNVNEIMIVVVLMEKTITRYKLTQQDALFEDYLWMDD